MSNGKYACTAIEGIFSLAVDHILMNTKNLKLIMKFYILSSEQKKSKFY